MKDQHFIEGGLGRAMKGAKQQITDLTEQIKAAVEFEYHSRLAEAGVMKRIYLRQQMKREIRRRVEQEVERIAPRNGLYFRS